MQIEDETKFCPKVNFCGKNNSREGKFEPFIKVVEGFCRQNEVQISPSMRGSPHSAGAPLTIHLMTCNLKVQRCRELGGRAWADRLAIDQMVV